MVCAVAAGRQASSLQEGGWFPTGYDLCQGQAIGSGPRLCAESTDFGELGMALGVQELGTGKGECVGVQDLFVCALGHVPCPLRVTISRAQWHSLA